MMSLLSRLDNAARAACFDARNQGATDHYAVTLSFDNVTLRTFTAINDSFCIAALPIPPRTA
jgi:hypothetical protein